MNGPELALACAFALTSAWGVPKPEVLLEVGETEKVARASEGDIVELKDGRLLLAYSEFPAGQSGRHPSHHDNASAVIVSQVSEDRGRTWSSPRAIVTPGKGDLNVMSVSFLRLRDGRLALFYLSKKAESDCRPVMRVSDDEGETWGAPRACVDEAHRDYYVLNNARAVRLSTGRIVLPLARHSVDTGDPQGCESEGRLCVAASDDDGLTWRMICEPFKVFDWLRSRVTAQEPGIVELKDGRLLMWARTNRRAQWGMYSADGGATWGKAAPLPLVSPNLAPATVMRLKDGNLVAVWNDYSRKPADADSQSFAERREPFSVAWSKDDGRTWSPSRTIEADPPGVRPDLYCCYFAVREIDDALFVFHVHHDGLKLSHLTRVPLAWIYAKEEDLREEPKLGEIESPFLKAVPVWPYGEGMVNKMNFSVRFKARFDAEAGRRAMLRVTGASAYRIRLNGAFVGHGPARSPKGFFRVDEWPLDKALRRTGNALEIEVAGYSCNSYCHMDQPAFVQAEVVSEDGKVLVATTGKGGGFSAETTERVRKVPRYSFQRAFAEAYRMGGRPAEPMAIERRAPVRYLDRIASYPTFALNVRPRILSRAKAAHDPCAHVKGVRFVDTDGRNSQFKAFDKEDLEVNLWAEMQKVRLSERTPCDGARVERVSLADGESAMLDVGLNDSGFAGMRVSVSKPGRLLFTFDEVLTDGEIDPTRLDCCNAVEWRFETPGTYDIETFEPYVFRYANLISLGGVMDVADFHVRAFKNPDAGRASFRCSDPALEKVFEAARETFAQNAVDVFTDCPSRERAGWLCDSFFIGRVNALLTGDTKLERLFLQNFAIPDVYGHLPAGAIPMCYPADHLNGRFIPNWGMWLAIEAEEYLKRSGDRETVEALKPRLLAFVDYMKSFRNADGLLERLPSWIFLEWSQASELVQDVNYPSNMTWAEVLDVMNRLYGLPELAAEAERTRETVRRQSWTGEWFCDNAVRQADGELKLSGECTETCQYYAFFFRTATPRTHPRLWKTLVDDFGPKRLSADRQTVKSHPKIWPSNAFIGNYLRFECLAREGLAETVLDEMRDAFLYMAERTGTLWEMISPTASCDHGFASHAAVYLFRDLLGVKSVDAKTRNVVVVPPDRLDLDWIEGTLPVAPDLTVTVGWRKGEEPAVRWNEAR